MSAREPSDVILKRLLEPTWQRSPPLQITLDEIPMSARICDLGAGGRRVRPDAVCVDVAPGPDVDVVCDAHEITLPDEEFDLVICTGTLNLCVKPDKVLTEVCRILKPGGLLHLEVGMFQPYNPEPEDYWRWTLAGLRLLHTRAGFEEVRSGPHIGPMSALACSAMYLTGRVFAGPSIVNKAVRAASHGVFGPMKYLDKLISDEAFEKTPFAYGIFHVGKKIDGPA